MMEIRSFKWNQTTKSNNKIQGLLVILFICLIAMSGFGHARDGTDDEWDVVDNQQQFDGVDSQFNQQFFDQEPQQVKYQDQPKSNSTWDQKMKQHRELGKFHQENRVGHFYASFSFQILNHYQQFVFHLPTDHDVYLLVRVYTLRGNMYGEVKDIETQPAIHIVVYENNHRIIAEHSFHFTYAVKISGKANSTYMIRFFSSSHRLIMVMHNNFIQTSFFEGKIQSSKIQEHQMKINFLNNKLKNIFKTLRTTHHVQFNQRYNVTQKINRFATFQIIQMLLVVALCLFQIKIISKLFKTQSIV